MVDGFKGKCKPTWLNSNRWFHRIDGGISGFFKLTKKRFGFYWKTGEEFHGIIRNGIVYSTEIKRDEDRI